MVGWLVEKQYVGSIPSQLSKDDPRLLAVTQFGHLLDLHFPRNAEPTKILPLILPRRAGIDSIEEFEWSLIQLQYIDEVLREATNL